MRPLSEAHEAVQHRERVSERALPKMHPDQWARSTKTNPKCHISKGKNVGSEGTDAEVPGTLGVMNQGNGDKQVENQMEVPGEKA